MIRPSALFLAGCIAAIGASQAPEFIQQYKQRLGGSIDELAAIVEQFDRDARSAGLDRTAALARYRASSDQFFVRRGQSMSATLERWHDLSDHWRAFDSTPEAAALPVLLSRLDRDLASRTWQSFRPAVPVTTEGLAYAGLGFVLGYLTLGSLISLLGGGRRSRRSAAIRTG